MTDMTNNLCFDNYRNNSDAAPSLLSADPCPIKCIYFKMCSWAFIGFQETGAKHTYAHIAECPSSLAANTRQSKETSLPASFPLSPSIPRGGSLPLSLTDHQ